MPYCHKGRGFPDVENDVQFGKVYIRIDGDDDELEKLRDTLKANKAKIRCDIETKPWGLRDLVVEDPDGVSAVPRSQGNKTSVNATAVWLTAVQNVITFNQRVKNFQRPADTIFESSSKDKDQN